MTIQSQYMPKRLSKKVYHPFPLYQLTDIITIHESIVHNNDA